MGSERRGESDALAFLSATLRRGPLGLIEALRETPLPPRPTFSSSSISSKRSSLPRQRREPPRRGGCVRRAAARHGRPARDAGVRRHHHAVGLPRPLCRVRRLAGGDEQEPVPDAAVDPRTTSDGDYRPSQSLRRRHRADAGQSPPQRHRLRSKSTAVDATRPDAHVAGQRRRASLRTAITGRSHSRITRPLAGSRWPCPITQTRRSTNWRPTNNGGSPRSCSAA